MDISQQLQDAIRERQARESLYAISDGSDVSLPQLTRYLKGERSIDIKTAAKLATYLDLELVPTRTPKRKK